VLRPTIPPRPWVAAGFEGYLRRLASRHFAAVHLRVPAAVPVGGRPLPTIFVANHTNWWDGFLAYLVGRALGTSFYVLMEARHLARYRFFLRVGALPLDRASAPRAYADLERARGVLSAGAGLWVFPQGARRPATDPVAGLEAGAAHLALTSSTPVRICPVGFRYGYLGEHLPEAFAWVGESWVVEPGDGNRRALTGEIGGRISEVLRELDAARNAERLAEFRPLVRGSISLNKRLDRLRHRLGWLDGPYEARNG
jgi:1-acyl-sn-glycerol-3-phosphate acyltransferase